MNENILVGVCVSGDFMPYQCVYSLMKLNDTLLQNKVSHQIHFVGRLYEPAKMHNYFGTMALFGDKTGREFTHLLLVDGDRCFLSDDILKMLRADKNIIGLVFPLPGVHWGQVSEAARRSIPAEILTHFSGWPDIESEGFALNDAPMPVPSLKMGTVLIRTEVFKAFVAAHPERKYRLAPGEMAFRAGVITELYDFFRVGVDEQTQKYRDDWFFLDVKALGFDSWLLPSATTSRVASYSFSLNIPVVESLANGGRA